MDFFKWFSSDQNINSEEDLLATIHSKYKKNYHFTYIGMTVVAINPFMAFPQLYCPKMINTYQQNNILQLPPHIFGSFEYAYFRMKNFFEDQCIFLFGESGSGKTAVRKHAIRYLTSERNQGELRKVAEQIVNVDQIVNAFGNAKIEFNESSTRHVMFFDLEFDFKGEIAGATINECALEKSRVVSYKNNERNFNIFYQLITGADVRLLKTLKLQRNSSNFALLNCAKNNSNNLHNDSIQFAKTKECLATLAFDENEALFIWKMIASILKIGNIEFVSKKINITGTDSCSLSSEYELYEVCDLLLIDVYSLELALTRRIINTKNDQIITDLTASEAAFVRDILCKTLYSRLFTWIIKKINDVIRPKKVGKRKCIGILDLFGFENHKNNSYDIFIKNYCNELVLKVFVDTNLKNEQELYLSQEIHWPIIDSNYSNVSSEIENNVFSVLNEDCFYLNLTEQQLLHQFTKNNSKCISCASCEKINSSKCNLKVDLVDQSTIEEHYTFTVKHYFKNIYYDIRDFQLKNTEQKLTKELYSIFYNSSLPALQEMFPEGSNKITIHKRSISQCSQVNSTVKNLLNLAIKERKNHFIHCFLPNSDFLLQEKQLNKNKLNENMTETGIINLNFDLIYFANQFHSRKLFNYWKLIKHGFCEKFKLKNFHKLYKVILKSSFINLRKNQKNLQQIYCNKCQNINNYICPEYMHNDESGLVNEVCEILWKMDIKPEEIVFGTDYLFIKNFDTLFKMEQIKMNIINYLVICIQRAWRRSLLRRRFLLMKQSQITISKNFLNYKRKNFFLNLTKNLPSLSPIDNNWPIAPLFLQELNEFFYYLFHQWRCKLYRMNFDQVSCNRMREKVTASNLFKNRKLTYEKSVQHPFRGDYLRLRNNIKWKKVSEQSDGFYIVFADLVNKISTNGKYNQFVMALSTCSILVLDHRTLHIKYRIPVENVSQLSVSPFLDDFLIIHLQWPYSNKEKFYMLLEIEHLIEFVTKLILVIQNATLKFLDVHVNEEIQINQCKEISLVNFISSKNKQKSSNPARIVRKFNKLQVFLNT